MEQHQMTRGRLLLPAGDAHEIIHAQRPAGRQPLEHGDARVVGQHPKHVGGVYLKERIE